jgi:hypothetical protein
MEEPAISAVSSNARSAFPLWPVLLSLTIIIVGLGAHGVTLGLSSHGDSRAIVENSIPAILHGSYVPSRSFGVPLYEAVSALLFGATGSLTVVNWYSVVLSVISLLVFARLVDSSLGIVRRSLVLAGFALNPLVLINSSALIEWMQMTFFLVMLLATARSWLDHRRRRDLIGYGLASAMLVLTRPDAVVICAALALALLWETRFAPQWAFQLIGSNMVAGIITAMIFLAINHGTHFLTGYSPSHDPFSRRLGVAVMGVLDVFGPLGMVVITIFALNLAHRAVLHEGAEISWVGRLLLVAAPMYAARFIVLPAKLEYLLPLVIVVLLAVAQERLALPWVAIIAMSLTITSVICVSLFSRTRGKDRLTVAIAVNRGAVAQDWEVTRYNSLLVQQGFLDQLSDIVYAGEPRPTPRLQAPKFDIGITSEMGDLIIGEEQLYQLDNQRFPLPRFKRATYRRIYVCEGSIAGFRPGWRVLQRPPMLPGIDPKTGRLVLKCTREGSRTSEAGGLEARGRRAPLGGTFNRRDSPAASGEEPISHLNT